MTMPSAEGASAPPVDTLQSTDETLEHGRHGRVDDAPVAVPTSVTNAFYALMAALALTFVNGLIAVISPPSTKDYADFIQGMHFPTDPAATRTAAAAGNTSAMLNLVAIVVFVAIFVYLGMLMRQGSAWSRIVIAVLAVLGVLGGVGVAVLHSMIALPLAGGQVGIVLLVLLAAALVAYLVFAFRSSSNRFFATSGW